MHLNIAIKRDNVIYSLFLLLILSFAIYSMVIEGKGVYSDYSSFYYAGTQWWKGNNPYLGGSLAELGIFTQAEAYMVQVPPNMTPILYFLGYPLWHMEYVLSFYIYSWTGVGLALYAVGKWCIRHEFNSIIGCILYSATYCFSENLLIGQVGNYVFYIVTMVMFSYYDKGINSINYCLWVVILILVKPFFGLIFFYHFIQKEYKTLLILLGFTLFMYLALFQFNMEWLNSYRLTAKFPQPIAMSLNFGLSGIIKFIENSYVFLGVYGVLCFLSLVYLIKSRAGVFKFIYFALLINPMTLIYYFNLCLVPLIMVSRDKYKLYVGLFYLALINIPITRYISSYVLNVYQMGTFDWYKVIIQLIQIIGVLSLILLVSNKIEGDL